MDEEFKKAAQEFKNWNKKYLSDSIITPDVARTGQARIGQTVWTRFTPSASFVSENWLDAFDFLLNADPDLLDDDTDEERWNLMNDFVAWADLNLNEGAMFSKRLSGLHKVYLRRYYRQNRQKILAKIKQRKRTIQGIQYDKKKKKMEKIGQTAKGKQMKKNTISTSGEHRRAD